LNLVFRYQNNDAVHKPLKRFAFVIPTAGSPPDNETLENKISENKLLRKGLMKMLWFQGHGNLFIYNELDEKIQDRILLSFLKKYQG